MAVIGGGAAGTAAAWTLGRGGAHVTLYYDRPGATALYSGALDLGLDEVPDPTAFADVRAFADALAIWSVGAASSRVATYEGMMRPARGIDSALLDLAPLSGKTVGVVALPLGDWDGEFLARQLTGSGWAKEAATRFVPVRIEGVFDPDDAPSSGFDVALANDDPARLARFAEALSKSTNGVDGFLCGAWFGTTPGVAARLRRLVGKPCGETTSRPGDAAGARFDAARDALLATAGIVVRKEPLAAIDRRGPRWTLIAGPGAMTANDFGFDAVVLAMGGILGGGIVLDDPRGNAPPVFRAGLAVPVEVGFDEVAAHALASPHGVDLGTLGVNAVERVGILTRGERIPECDGLFAAGDCIAGRPRTVLEAVRAGIAAAKAALAR
jgi:glycerol-3-phosphate dehydrogenase subunit B